MSIVFSNEITVDSVNTIRRMKGWSQIHPQELQASLDGSSYVVAAYDDDQALGVALLLWDGGFKAMITNILVVPDCQVQGLEKKLIEEILNFLRGKLKPGFGIQLDIKAWNDEVKMYESIGFQVSTHERRGVPMHICLTDQIELTDAMFKQHGYE